MGNLFGIGFDRPPSSQVVTLPMQKVPTREGASGLHYSGRIYANEINKLSSDICNSGPVSPDKINDVMPKSISTTSISVDPSTKRLDKGRLQNYIEGLVANGLIPGKKPSFDAQMVADSDFYSAIQAEYCFYESRYVASLKQFITLVSNPQGSDTSSALQATVNLNARLNTLLEILNYVGNRRAETVNQRAPQIVDANKQLQEKIAILHKQKEFLQTSDVRIRTQEEMMRYSAEKSRAMNIQIMFFVALNVVALGTIITVYKTLKPTAI